MIIQQQNQYHFNNKIHQMYIIINNLHKLLIKLIEILLIKLIKNVIKIMDMMIKVQSSYYHITIIIKNKKMIFKHWKLLSRMLNITVSNYNIKTIKKIVIWVKIKIII